MTYSSEKGKSEEHLPKREKSTIPAKGGNNAGTAGITDHRSLLKIIEILSRRVLRGGGGGRVKGKRSQTQGKKRERNGGETLPLKNITRGGPEGRGKMVAK